MNDLSLLKVIVVSSTTFGILLIVSNIIIGAYYIRKIRCRIDIPNTDPSIHIIIKYTTDKDYSIHGSAMKSAKKIKTLKNGICIGKYAYSHA